MLIDSHAHLTDPRLDAQQIIADMGKDGLSHIITVGFNAQTSLQGVEIAQSNPNVYACVGIHPSDVNEPNADLGLIRSLSKQSKVVAIGEIGLDYHYDNVDKARQAEYFVSQLRIAKDANLPVVIHLRDAYLDMQGLIESNIDCFTRPALMHCFSGSKETVDYYVEKGFYISFSGVITFKNALKFREIVKAVPLDKILVETDCPYLSPEPFRGSVNSPKNVRFTAMKVAEFLGLPFDEVARITSDNTKRFFGGLL